MNRFISIRFNALVILSMSLLLDPNEAFVPARMQRIVASSSALNDAEESEWFSPPVPVTTRNHLQTPTMSKAPNPFAVETSDPLRQPGVQPAETIIECDEDFRNFVYDNTDQRITVVKYHATWCRTCARLSMHIEKLMNQHGDFVHKSSGKVERKGSVRFASIEWGANEDVCRRHGVETVPTTRIYVGGQLVEEITGGPKEFGRIQEVVEYLLEDKNSYYFDLNKDLEFTLNQGSALISSLSMDKALSDGASLAFSSRVDHVPECRYIENNASPERKVHPAAVASLLDRLAQTKTVSSIL